MLPSSATVIHLLIGTSMKSDASTPKAYIDGLPEERKSAVRKIRSTIKKNLPKGFVEQMSYGMLGYVVPHRIYPAGYHCNPHLPLPFINLASQKNYIALYHLGIYVDKTLLEWFVGEYAQRVTTKLDMGKSCVRFRKLAQIPYDLIGDLAGKMSLESYIALYEQGIDDRR